MLAEEKFAIARPPSPQAEPARAPQIRSVPRAGCENPVRHRDDGGMEVAASTNCMTSVFHTSLRQLGSLFTFASFPRSWSTPLALIRNRKFQAYFVIAFTLWLVGAVEIIQKAGGQKLDPRFWMLLAILITIYSGGRIFRLVPRISNVRAVNALPPGFHDMINRIQALGLSVFQGTGGSSSPGEFVAVGPGGVYAFEVKSRKVFGSRRIEFRDQRELLLGGRISDRRPLRQAEAMAQNLREKLKGIVVRRSAVKPLVVFLNDWTVIASPAETPVPVVSEAELEGFLNRQEPIFSESQVAEISARLAA